MICMGKWHIQSTTSSLMYLKFTDWPQKQRFFSFVLKRKTALCFFSIYVCVYCAYIESTVVFFQSLIRVFQICLLNVGHACMYVCMCRVSSSTLLWWSHLVSHLLRYTCGSAIYKTYDFPIRVCDSSDIERKGAVFCSLQQF